ncbi:MAG TPA: sigma-70 family RNA polymerase sigma factor [Kofleriaceae bacterium]|nr:sigma-70 family RNA polymerase sigma factor [Kofleriaceae bacterium]
MQRLMTAAGDGDRAAIEPLFSTLRPVCLCYATRLVGDPAVAEDVVQDALVALFGQLARFDRDRDALAWAFAIVTWECRTVRRRRARSREVHTVHIELDVTAVNIAERELVRHALAELDGLAPRDRDVIAAVIFDDDELRATLAPATFRKRLERAIARLRTAWRSRHGTL